LRVEGVGFRVEGGDHARPDHLALRALERKRAVLQGFRVQGSGFRVQGTGFRVQGTGFRFQSAGFRVQGSCCAGSASVRLNLSSVTRSGCSCGSASLEIRL